MTLIIFSPINKFLFLVPSLAPPNIRVTETTPDSITFTWDEIPCGHRNGYVYRYPWKLLNSADMTTVKSGETRQKTNIKIGGLTSCTSYTFEVAARTSLGAGPYSEGFVASTGIGGGRCFKKYKIRGVRIAYFNMETWGVA